MKKLLTISLLLVALADCTHKVRSTQFVSIADCSPEQRNATLQAVPTDLKHLVTGIIHCRTEPLEGARIMLKGSSQITYSDVQGHYEIDAPPNAVLVVTLLSYNCKETRVPEQGPLDIELSESM